MPLMLRFCIKISKLFRSQEKLIGKIGAGFALVLIVFSSPTLMAGEDGTILNGAFGECVKKIAPVLMCGRLGANPKYDDGVDCWLDNCMGEFSKFQKTQIDLIGPENKSLEISVKIDGPSFGVRTTQRLEKGKRYKLRIDLKEIKTEEGQPIEASLPQEKDGTYVFTFEGHAKATNSSLR